jgi:hypothetical protein
MLGFIWVLESIWAKNNLIAVFNNGLTCYIDIEPTFEGVMDAELMTIQLKLTILTMVHKNS